MNLAKNWKKLCLGSVALLATVTLVACGTSTSSSKKSAGNADLNKKHYYIMVIYYDATTD